MKNLLSVLLLVVSTTVLAGDTFDFDRYERKPYFGTSYSFDVANAFIGGSRNTEGVRRNEQALDLVARVTGGFSRVEFGATIEIFDAINYYAIGLDVNYVQPIIRTDKISLVGLVGAQLDIVSRKGLEETPELKQDSLEHFVPSLNLRLRGENLLGTGFFGELQLRSTYRADIEYLWGRDATPNILSKDSMSGYFGIGYKW